MLTNQECQERVHSGEIRGASVCHAQRRSRSEPAVRRCEESWPHFSPTALCWGSGPQQATCFAWWAGKRWNKPPLYFASDMQKCPLVDMDYFGRDLMSVFKFTLILSSYLSLASARFPFLFQALSSTTLLSLYLPNSIVCLFVCTACLWFVVSAFRSELKSLESKWDRLIELGRQFQINMH